MNILFQSNHPFLLFVFSFTIAAIFAYWLHKKNQRNAEVSKKMRKLMASVRFIAVFLTAMLLLAPLVELIETSSQKPILIVATDNSTSMKEAVSENLMDSILNLNHSLQNKFEIHQYTFGNEIHLNKTPDFTEKISDYAQIIEQTSNNYSTNNVGAMILIGDGIYNTGESPLYAANESNFPIYTVAVGNPNPLSDIQILKIEHNSVAFQGNTFPIKVYVQANLLIGKQAKIQIENNGKILEVKTIAVDQDNFNQIINFNVNANKSGIQYYTISIHTSEKEQNKINNQATAVVDIIKNKQKIAILYHTPHPDVAAFARILKKYPNFTIETSTVNDFNKDPKEFDLLILNQLPSINGRETILFKQILANQTPYLMIVGKQTNLQALNSMNQGIIINQSKGLFEMAGAVTNSNFTYFNTNAKLKDFINNTSPLNCVFGNYQISKEFQPLAFQKIKNIETSIPLILATDNTTSLNAKRAFILGEGIWQWPIYDYKINGSHENFESLVSKLIQFLTTKTLKDNFRIKSKRIILENSDISFDAEYYNKNFEPDNRYNLDLILKDSLNNISKFQFQKTDEAYALSIGSLPIGKYSFTATLTQSDKNKISKIGSFVVVENELEKTNLQANYSLMRELAHKSNGLSFNSNQFEQLKDSINNLKSKPVLESKIEQQNILHFRWIIFIIILFFSIDWLLTKYNGIL